LDHTERGDDAMANRPDIMEKDEKSYAAGGSAVAKDSSSDDAQPYHTDVQHEELGLWTRIGVTPESFKRRTGGNEHNQLNQTLKNRHLQMIAIGTSLPTSWTMTPC
jgi:amino acid permease